MTLEKQMEIIIMLQAFNLTETEAELATETIKSILDD